METLENSYDRTSRGGGQRPPREETVQIEVRGRIAGFDERSRSLWNGPVWCINGTIMVIEHPPYVGHGLLGKEHKHPALNDSRHRDSNAEPHRFQNSLIPDAAIALI